MQNTDMLMSRYGVEMPAGTPVPAVVSQFLQWLSDNHWTTAVEICPWDGREGGFFGAHAALDVVDEFISTDKPGYDDLIDFVASYFNQELAKDGLAEPDFDAIEEDAAMRAALDAYENKIDEMTQMMRETAAEAAGGAVAAIDRKRMPVYRSALIKSIRRSLVDDAIYWSAVLHQLGFAKAVWWRLMIHCSEDIGVAEPQLPATIRALFDNYMSLMGANQQDSAIIVYTHAVMLMAMAQKNRAVDNAVICYYKKPLVPRPVPDYAFDHHVAEGRAMGRDVRFFLDESSQLIPDTLPDNYKQEARETLLARLQQETAVRTED